MVAEGGQLPERRVHGVRLGGVVGDGVEGVPGHRGAVGAVDQRQRSGVPLHQVENQAQCRQNARLKKWGEGSVKKRFTQTQHTRRGQQRQASQTFQERGDKVDGQMPEMASK